MAQSLLPSSIELRAFVKDLYDYIWSQHKFHTPVYVRIYADLKRLTIEQHDEKLKSHFTEPIGKAVLNSQYLLREYCYKLFQTLGTDILQSRHFMYAVFIVVQKWIGPKKNVFIKFIASAAIIAEAILFCDAETEVFREPYEANKMLITFFDRKLFADFYKNGGWLELQELVLDKYSFVNEIVEPSIKSVNTAYQKLYYSCNLIKSLRTGFIAFPVSCAHICAKCESTSDDVYGFKYDTLLIKRLFASAELFCAPKEMTSVKEMKSDSKQSKSLRISNNSDQSSVSSEFDFICVFLGNDEKETFEMEMKKKFSKGKVLVKEVT